MNKTALEVAAKPYLQKQRPQVIHKNGDDFNLKATVDLYNQRIIINSCHIKDRVSFLAYLNKLIRQTNPTKIIACAQEDNLTLFMQHGFALEASNPYFFQGKPMYYLGKFRAQHRKVARDTSKQNAIVQSAQSRAYKQKHRPGQLKLPSNFILRRATPKDIPQLIKLYRKVFSSYPTPIDNTGYLHEMMTEETAYFIVITNQYKQIISAASADMDWTNLCAEVTDCATDPAYRGQKLMYYVVGELEQLCQNKGLYSLYTLARAQSPGINIVFSRNGYQYGGRLIQNCHICGDYEDMNLWTKKLCVRPSMVIP